MSSIVGGKCIIQTANTHGEHLVYRSNSRQQHLFIGLTVWELNHASDARRNSDDIESDSETQLRLQRPGKVYGQASLAVGTSSPHATV